jgi:hypothetical protein
LKKKWRYYINFDVYVIELVRCGEALSVYLIDELNTLGGLFLHSLEQTVESASAQESAHYLLTSDDLSSDPVVFLVERFRVPHFEENLSF